MLFDVGFNGGDQLRYAGKYTPTQTLARQVAEEAFDHIQPRCRGGSEMDVETWMFLQPLLHGGMLVGGIVVTDQMQGFVFGRFPINLAQKRQPLAVPMMWLTAGNDFAVQNIQCSKQRGGAVTLIIMSHGCGASSLQGQSWLRTIQRLN